MSENDRPTALYRLFNADDELLYIGISYDPPARFTTHKVMQTWWPEVTRHSLEWKDTRAIAEAAELRAIETELPRHNVVGHPDPIARSVRHVVPVHVERGLSGMAAADDGTVELWKVPGETRAQYIDRIVAAKPPMSDRERVELRAIFRDA